MSRRHFLDSSALYKLVGNEAESAALNDHLANAELITSTLTDVELRRTAMRNHVEHLTGVVLSRPFAISIDEMIIHRAGELQPAGLRSLDAIQLATALRVRHEIDSVICYDERLAAACRQHGLVVEQPA